MIIAVRALIDRIAQRPARVWHIQHADGEVIITIRQRGWLIAPAIALIGYCVWPLPLVLSGLVTLSSLLLIGFGWARAMATKVNASRSLRYTAVQVGDELEETMQLDNRSRVPVLWAEFVDHSNAPGYSIAGVQAAGRYESKRWREQTTCAQRGVFTLGPWEMRTGDPFGIFSVRHIYRQQNDILVYPPLAALSPELLPRQRKVGYLQLLHHAVSADTIDVATTRLYAPGDPLRRVHWRTTARQRQLFVKVFEPEASSTVWLIPDLDAKAHLGEGADSSLETMIVLIASLAAHLLSERLSVGLMLDADASQVVLPQYGQAHLWSILRALAVARPIPDRPFGHTLTQAKAIVSARDSVVVITPSLDPQWPPALQSIAGNRYNFGAEAVILDPSSFGRTADTAAFTALLAEQGFTAHIVRREDVRPISGTYGELRRWEFQTLGTGRVVVRQTPRAVSARDMA